MTDINISECLTQKMREEEIKVCKVEIKRGSNVNRGRGILKIPRPRFVL